MRTRVWQNHSIWFTDILIVIINSILIQKIGTPNEENEPRIHNYSTCLPTFAKYEYTAQVVSFIVFSIFIIIAINYNVLRLS